MSTQHPDNVNSPFFAENTELGGEDEIQEAYFGFSYLGCDEQMWDCEGKEVDNYVVKKLLTRYESCFKEKHLGKDVFITLRVPNPSVEKAEAKILLETLESIPRSFDAAKLFYGDDTPPIFEVILPMASSAESLNRIYRYYSDFVVGKQNKPLQQGDITISDWIGEFKPETINVIPLFESMEHMLDADRVVEAYLKNKEAARQRVFLARSDPAMNYGLVSAVLLNKIALQRLQKLSERTGVSICPIIGVGSAPFRGNLTPERVERVLEEYPSVQTFTIQSAFKYDYPPDTVREAIQAIRASKAGSAPAVDEKRCLEIIEKYSDEYARQISLLAPAINKLARYVPSRRKRKLHIGLFGYSRTMKGISLPRAITLTASLYSLGLPPEILGLTALNDDDLRFLKTVYVHFDDDLKDAFQYFNPDSGLLPKELESRIRNFPVEIAPHRDHREVTGRIAHLLRENETHDLTEHILRGASFRKFLG